MFPRIWEVESNKYSFLCLNLDDHSGQLLPHKPPVGYVGTQRLDAFRTSNV